MERIWGVARLIRKHFHVHLSSERPLHCKLLFSFRVHAGTRVPPPRGGQASPVGPRERPQESPFGSQNDSTHESAILYGSVHIAQGRRRIAFKVI